MPSGGAQPAAAAPAAASARPAKAPSVVAISGGAVAASLDPAASPTATAGGTVDGALPPVPAASTAAMEKGKPAKAVCLPRSAAISLAVCAAYACTSMALAMLNKALLSKYNFKGYFMLLACQMGFSYVVCVVTRDRLGNPFGVPAYSRASLRAAGGMGILYVLNVVMGMVGLKLVNVPVYFAIRRLTPAVIIGLEYGLYRKVVDGGTQVAVGVSVLGTLIAAWETLSSDGLGYAITLANNAVTAGLMISQKRFGEVQGAILAEQERAGREAATAAAGGAAADGAVAPTSPGAGAGAAPASSSPASPPAAPAAGSTAAAAASGPFGVLYYNAMIAAPLALALSAVTGELGYIASFPSLGDLKFQFGFAVSSVMGLALTYTSVLCTTYTGPLAASMTGNVKDIMTTAFGWAFFGGFVATAMSVGGLALSFLGAFLFGAVSLRKSQRAAAKAAEDAAAAAAKAGGGVPATSVIADSGSMPGQVSRRVTAAAAVAATPDAGAVGGSTPRRLSPALGGGGGGGAVLDSAAGVDADDEEAAGGERRPLVR